MEGTQILSHESMRGDLRITVKQHVNHMSDNMVDVVCPFTDHYFILKLHGFLCSFKTEKETQSSYIFVVSFFQTIKVNGDRSFHSA